MNPTEQMKRQQQYKTYVDQKTPRHNLWLNMLRAFLTGGAVCVLGQIIFNLCELQKLSQDAILFQTGGSPACAWECIFLSDASGTVESRGTENRKAVSEK